MKHAIIIIFSTLFSITLFAQVPQAFNYQGVARDLSGTPIPNQTIGLRIAILQETPTGTEVYKETHTTTTTSLGLFNLKIGTGTIVNGTFSNINWSNNNHFLQIEMDETGGNTYQLIGSSQLMSVPYALNAGNAYWTKTNDDIAYQNGHVGIGTSTPSSLVTIEAEGDDYNIAA